MFNNYFIMSYLKFNQYKMATYSYIINKIGIQSILYSDDHNNVKNGMISYLFYNYFDNTALIQIINNNGVVVIIPGNMYNETINNIDHFDIKLPDVILLEYYLMDAQTNQKYDLKKLCMTYLNNGFDTFKNILLFNKIIYNDNTVIIIRKKNKNSNDLLFVKNQYNLIDCLDTSLHDLC